MDERQLLELARALAVDRERWAPLAREDSLRWYAPLIRENDYEAWLLGWPQDQGIELHDHGGSAGAFVVVAGSLTETYLDRGRPRHPRRLRQRRWNVGQAVAFGPEHIHDVVNVRTTPALSVHVYSPPLAEMTFYGSRFNAGTDTALALATR